MASQKDLDSQPVFEIGYALAGNRIAHPLIGDAQSPGGFPLAPVFRVTARRLKSERPLARYSVPAGAAHALKVSSLSATFSGCLSGLAEYRLCQGSVSCTYKARHCRNSI